MDRLVDSYGDFHPSGSYTPSSSTFKGLPRHHLIFGCGSLHELWGEISLTMVMLGLCLHIWHNIISGIRGEAGYVNFKMPLKADSFGGKWSGTGGRWKPCSFYRYVVMAVARVVISHMAFICKV